MLLHGVCYDFFFVTGFMYTDSKAPADVRGQAQGMLVFFTQGVGMFFGYMIAGCAVRAPMCPDYEELGDAIAAAATPEGAQFGRVARADVQRRQAERSTRRCCRKR